MMNKKIYVLNPNYCLLDDVKRVLLTSVESEKSVPEIDCNDDFRIMLHPDGMEILAYSIAKGYIYIKATYRFVQTALDGIASLANKFVATNTKRFR